MKIMMAIVGILAVLLGLIIQDSFTAIVGQIWLVGSILKED